MYNDDDLIIEVAGGGGAQIGIDRMTYYDSYVLAGSNYTSVLTPGSGEDQLSFVGSASTTGDGTIVAGALWLFNDGTTPLPSMQPDYVLPRLGVPVGDYVGVAPSFTIDMGRSLSAFDPSTITSLADLLTEIPVETGLMEIDCEARSTAGTNSETRTDANIFSRLDTPTADTFGIAIYIRHFSFFSVTSTSFTFNLGNKDLRVRV